MISTTFCLLNGFNQILFCLPLSLVGFADDLWKVPAKYRYIAQLLIGILIIQKSPLNEYLSNNSNFYLEKFIFLLIILIFTGVVNFINFMDGIDGLITGSFIFIISGAILILNMQIAPLLFALIAFLFFNWSPAKSFMGDSGSLFLGGVYGYILLQCKNLEELAALLLIASPLLIDAFTCLVRRFINHENIFVGHKKHLYQRLNQAGWKHSKISFFYICFILLELISYLTLGITLQIFTTFLIIIVGFYLDINIAIRFKSKFTH